MKTDFLITKKSIHIKLDRKTHSLLRAILFTYNLSMQDIFEEFANLLVMGDVRARKIIDELVVKNVKESYTNSFSGQIGEYTPQRDDSFDVKDKDIIYDLIESKKNDK